MTDYKNLPHSYTGGVRPMNIEGRFGHERARLSGEFTDADRAWRKQWLKDQILAHDEPRHVPELEASCKNPIRRFYQYPFAKLEAALTPIIGKNKAFAVRFTTSRFLSVYAGLLYFTYWVKYNPAEWTKMGGLEFFVSRGDCLPCHENFPSVTNRTKPSDYNDRGFSKRKVFLDL